MSTAAQYPAAFELKVSAWEGDHTSYTWQKNADYQKIVGETAQFYIIEDISRKPGGGIATRRVKKTNVQFAEGAPVLVEATPEAPAATHFAIVEVPGFEVVAMPYTSQPTQAEAEANFATLHTIGEVQVVTAKELGVMRCQLFGFSYKLREVAAAPAEPAPALVTPRQAIVTERTAAALDLMLAKQAFGLAQLSGEDLGGHYLEVEAAENRVYRAGIAKVLVSVLYNGQRCEVLGIAGEAAKTVLTLSVAGNRVEVPGVSVNPNYFEFEEFDAAPAIVPAVATDQPEELELAPFRSPNYDKNVDREGFDGTNCCLCGKRTNPETSKSIHLSFKTNNAVATDAEFEHSQGFHTIGPECAKKLPKRFVF